MARWHTHHHRQLAILPRQEVHVDGFLFLQHRAPAQIFLDIPILQIKLNDQHTPKISTAENNIARRCIGSTTHHECLQRRAGRPNRQLRVSLARSGSASADSDSDSRVFLVAASSSVPHLPVLCWWLRLRFWTTSFPTKRGDRRTELGDAADRAEACLLAGRSGFMFLL